MPAGRYSLAGTTYLGHSTQTMLLPYFDQANLYNALNTSAGFNSPPNFTKNSQTMLPGLLCPSNPVIEGVNWTGGTNPGSTDPNNDSARDPLRGNFGHRDGTVRPTQPGDCQW